MSGKSERTPFLSVAVPIYNAEKYIKRCIRSILSQSFEDFELILIDDGSSDRSGELCLALTDGDDRVRYEKIENGGSYHARLLGAEKSRGEYLMFCDADDFYLPDAFAKVRDILVENDVSLLQFGTVKKYNHLTARRPCTSSVLTVSENDLAKNEYPRLVCSTWDGAHLTTCVTDKVYKNSLARKLPASNGAPRVFWGEDLIMNLHMLENCGSAMFVPEICYCYCQNGGTKHFSKDTMRDLDTIKRYQLEFFERCEETRRDEIERRLFSEVAGWLFFYVREACEVLDSTEVGKLIRESLERERFVLAREYFLSHPEENWEAAELLRRGDAQEYIRHAELYRESIGLSEKIKSLLRRIYAAI